MVIEIDEFGGQVGDLPARAYVDRNIPGSKPRGTTTIGMLRLFRHNPRIRQSHLQKCDRHPTFPVPAIVTASAAGSFLLR